MKELKEKAKCFNLTINQGATCYNDIFNIINEINVYQYWGIKHNKDTNEDGEIKKEHYHLVLYFENPRHFTSIQKKFKGAHIEITNYLNMSVKYLLHLTEDSRNKEGNHIYTIDEIQTNNIDYVKSILMDKDTPTLTQEQIFIDIEKNNFYSISQFYKVYGMDQVKVFRNMIKDILNDLTLEDKIKYKAAIMIQNLTNENTIDITNFDNLMPF